MKFIALILSVLVSTTAFAGEFSFSVSPNEPIVINASIQIGDKECVAPWALVKMNFNNGLADLATIQAVKFDVTSEEGYKGTIDAVSEEGDIHYPHLMVLEPGKKGSKYYYLCGLPLSSTLTFDITAEAIGWSGPTTVDATERVSAITKFTAR